MRIGWAFVANGVQVDQNDGIEAIGQPIFEVTLNRDALAAGEHVVVPVIVWLTTEAVAGVTNFTISHTVYAPDGIDLGGRAVRSMLALTPPSAWPAHREYLAPIVQRVAIDANVPGAYEIEIWLDDQRAEGVHVVLAVASDPPFRPTE